MVVMAPSQLSAPAIASDGQIHGDHIADKMSQSQGSRSHRRARLRIYCRHIEDWQQTEVGAGDLWLRVVLPPLPSRLAHTPQTTEAMSAVPDAAVSLQIFPLSSSGPF
jgi:hypothetical protein